MAALPPSGAQAELILAAKGAAVVLAGLFEHISDLEAELACPALARLEDAILAAEAERSSDAVDYALSFIARVTADDAAVRS